MHNKYLLSLGQVVLHTMIEHFYCKLLVVLLNSLCIYFGIILQTV